jgi:succinoglycan biosynthesis protein ExoU
MLANQFSPLESAPADAANSAVRRDVTVVIAAWRAAGTLGRAVATALAQPEAAEVVVVDDASGDDGATLAAARAADDGTGRLIVLALEKNSGPSAARNAAIAASKAPWITILDSDDYFEPGRLKGLMAQADKGYDLIADDLMRVKEGAPRETAETMWFTADDNTPVDVDFTHFIKNSVPQSNRRTELGFVKPMMRRAFLDAHDIRYDERMRIGEDFDIYARMLFAGGRMRLIPWTGYISVMRAKSLSTHHSRHDLMQLDNANTHLLDKASKAKDAKLLRLHRSFIRRRIAWIDIMDALKRGNIFLASWTMIKDPRQAPYLAGLFRNWIVYRIRGRK